MRSTPKYLHAFLTLCLIPGTILFAETHVIVDDGQPRAVVVVADNPSPTARYAASEFIHHVELATGVALPVVAESDVPHEPPGRIVIGLTESSHALGIDPADLGPDTFVLRRVDDSIFVFGNEDRTKDPLDERNAASGTLFGVYELLERTLGVRWLWPGELGTFVPPTDSLAIGELDETVNPALRFRRFRWNRVEEALGWRGASREPGWIERDHDLRYPEELERIAFSPEGLRRHGRDLVVFLRRHRLGYSEPKPQVGHYFGGWGERYGDEHPDWFMLSQDGERGPPPGAGDFQIRHVAMCVSNPELHRYIVEEAWDGGDILRLGEADTARYCHCENCLSWDGPQPGDAAGRIISDRYARFWKTIRELAVERNPDVLVTTFLYVNYFPHPLTDIRLNENVYGEFTPWSRFMVWYPTTEEQREWQRQQWLGWAKTGITMAYRPNHTKTGYVLPHVNTWQGGEFIRFAYDHGMIGIDYDDLSGQWAVKGPEHYMYLRLLVDPAQSIESIRREYFSGFGPAAKHVERYFDYWEDHNHRLQEDGLWHDIRFNPRYAPRQYPPDVFPPAEAMLEDAMAAAREDPSPEFARRVAFLQTGLEHGKLSVRFIRKLVDEHPDARNALQELVHFRREHESLHISSYVNAARGELRYFGDEIDALFQDADGESR